MASNRSNKIQKTKTKPSILLLHPSLSHMLSLTHKNTVKKLNKKMIKKEMKGQKRKEKKKKKKKEKEKEKRKVKTPQD